MKKHLLVICLTLLTFAVQGAKAETYSGVDGIITWSLNTSTRVLTLNGNGSMNNYSSGSKWYYDSEKDCDYHVTDAPWGEYHEYISYVVIQPGVTSIGDYAFFNCLCLHEVTIPEGVTSIGEYAFKGCSLASITIPEGVTSIERYAFGGCTNLTSITIPDSVTSIEQYAFYGCRSLNSITMKSSSPCTLGGSSVFPSSNEGFKIYVPYGSGETYKSAEGWSSYADYIVESIPDPITGVDENITWSLDTISGVLTLSGNGAMNDYEGPNDTPWNEYNSYIKEVVIQNGVASIGNYAFQDCSSLVSVTIPEGVTSIGECAFRYCSSLSSINIPESVTSVGEGAFVDCTSLPVENYIRYADTYLVEAVDKEQSSYTIKEGTRWIGGHAFDTCLNLTSIVIPEGVTSIGIGAFYSCGLVNITIPEGVVIIKRVAFFYNCSLSLVTLPNSLETIEEQAFDLTSIESVVIPENVSCIEGFAFGSNCASIEVDSENEYYSSIDGVLFNKDASKIMMFPANKDVAEYAIPSSVTSIGNNAFWGANRLTAISLPAPLETIEDRGFFGCKGLTQLSIPEKVTSIGFQAFLGCSGLQSIDLNDSISSIGLEAFAGCSNLTSVTIPEKCMFSGRVFGDCANLSDVYIMNPQPTGENLFENCESLTTIHVPYGCGDAYRAADGWSDYVDYIVEMEEEPADDDSGTPTPELLPTTDLSEYDYALYFPETEVNTDVEVAIPLNLKNAEENITAFQCDIYLPEGVKWASSIDKRGNEILTQPTFNADADRTDANYHTITPVTKMSNGAYRVMCYSMNKEIFLDNDGAVLDIPVVIPEDMEDGDYNLIIKDIFITDTDTEQHEVEEVVSKLTVVGYTLGDPNADGLINITDIVSVISYILEEAPANFNFKAADVNGDGIINITDIVGIIDIILSDEAPASAQRIRRPAFGSAPAGLTSLEIVPFGIDAGTTSATVTLDLLNPNDEFTAFECDIVLPDGIDWEYTTDRRGNIIYTQPTFNAEADRTDANYHTLSNIKKMEDGSFKMMCYSMAKEIFLDEAGAILNLPLTFSPELAEGIYEIEVANTVLTRTDVTDKKIGSYRASVVVGTPAVQSAVIYGDVNATAVAMINERLAGCGTLDLRSALAVDGNTAFTLNDNAVIFVADGMSIKNEKNVVEDGTCAVLTLTDGVAFTPSESFTAESATYGRSLGKDEYGTLVLPFEPNAATKAAYAFYKLSEADGSTLTFDETTTPEAGTPYVIVSKDAATTFAGSGAIAVTAGDAMADGWTMKGTYETLVFTDATELASLYCLSGNQFKQAKSKLTMNPFRAYFQGSGSVGSITLRGSDGTTRILSETLEPAGDCYDLTGRRVLNAEKGVYIVNGKKVLK